MNPRIQLPGIIERYQEIFLEETSGEHASMASLYAQVFMQSDDGTDFSLADRFLEQIEENFKGKPAAPWRILYGYFY